VLVRHGLAELAVRLGLEGRLRFGRKSQPGTAALSEPERLVKALEELGPTFIKLGQMLSTRPDVVPPDFVKALAKLQDGVPGIRYEEVESVAATEACRLPEDVFSEFDRSLRLELDFVHEGQNAGICRRSFADDESVVVPKIHWNYTTSRRLVLDLLTGMKATDAAWPRSKGSVCSSILISTSSMR
jgi:predicted unusual protein kinase regulating ubiquinone biosynthesis (AarF/ABC1/UbiB family)